MVFIFKYSHFISTCFCFIFCFRICVILLFIALKIWNIHILNHFQMSLLFLVFLEWFHLHTVDVLAVVLHTNFLWVFWNFGELLLSRRLLLACLFCFSLYISFSLDSFLSHSFTVASIPSIPRFLVHPLILGSWTI